MRPGARRRPSRPRRGCRRSSPPGGWWRRGGPAPASLDPSGKPVVQEVLLDLVLVATRVGRWVAGLVRRRSPSRSEEPGPSSASRAGQRAPRRTPGSGEPRRSCTFAHPCRCPGTSRRGARAVAERSSEGAQRAGRRGRGSQPAGRASRGAPSAGFVRASRVHLRARAASRRASPARSRYGHTGRRASRLRRPGRRPRSAMPLLDDPLDVRDDILGGGDLGVEALGRDLPDRLAPMAHDAIGGGRKVACPSWAGVTMRRHAMRETLMSHEEDENGQRKLDHLSREHHGAHRRAAHDNDD